MYNEQYAAYIRIVDGKTNSICMDIMDVGNEVGFFHL
jgi:hypothetical protein